MFDLECNLFLLVVLLSGGVDGVSSVLMCIFAFLSGTMFGAMLDMLTDR